MKQPAMEAYFKENVGILLQEHFDLTFSLIIVLYQCFWKYIKTLPTTPDRDV